MSRMKNIIDNLVAKVQEFNIEMTNLKLHDLNWYMCENDLDMRNFNWFCEDEYNNFKEFLEEKNCRIEGVGRTSSFFILPKYNGYRYAFERENREMIFNEYGWYSECVGGCLDTDIEDIENEEYNISYLLPAIDSLMEDLENVKKVYEYIENFKENQVNYYKDYEYEYGYESEVM